MSTLFSTVDARTRLAGANRLEILLFSLGHNTLTERNEVFGINVFKIREVIAVPAVTSAPDMPPGVKGMVSLRGTMIPVVDLAHFCGMQVKEEPKIMIVTEFNRSTQGFLVSSVEQILRMDWNQIKVPPAMMANRYNGLVTAVTELEDGRIAMVLDVEKILDETCKTIEDTSLFEGIEKIEEPTTIFFADDSMVARKQIAKTLDQMGVKHLSAKNGQDALNKLHDLADEAAAKNVPLKDVLHLILTDVEMPEMDGYVLTKEIKSDKRFDGIPVVMHSSLSAEANITIGKTVGVDAYVAKFDPKELVSTLQSVLKKEHRPAN